MHINRVALILLVCILATGCQSKIKLLDVNSKEDISMEISLPERGKLLGEDLVVVEEDVNSSKINSLYAGILVDTKEQKLLVSKNAYERVYPASITMLATALTILENMDLDKEITVSKKSLKDLLGASTVGLKVGDKVTVEQLLYGMILSSGIDAANTLAIECSGSIKAFAKLMNQTVAKIGCVDTHFTNPGGITDINHYTTVYDLYILMNHLMQDDEFMQIVKHKSFNAIYKQKKGSVNKQTYTSTISYLNGDRKVPSGVTVLGGKTGTTASAGCCLSLFLQDDKGKNYIAIGMKAADKDTLYSQMEILIQKILN